MADAFIALRVALLTISDTRTLDDDRSGAYLEQSLLEAGHEVVSREIVRDEVDAIVARFRAHMADEIDVILTTGGTGLTRRDVTPEAVEAVTTKAIPGFGELFRMLSYEEIGTSTIQSRATAALCGPSLVFALPGSTGACRTAFERILKTQLDARHKPCNFAELLPRMRGQATKN
jgi:molybdenum cofactor biosynthesis protein B